MNWPGLKRIFSISKPRRAKAFPGATQADPSDQLQARVGTALQIGNPPQWDAAVLDFANEICQLTGAKYAIGANSGTTAIYLALKACEVGPGDEVITVANSWVSTVTAIVELGATPRFVDVDQNSGTMDPSALGAAINESTKAILPVHMYGIPADMPAILAVARQHGLAVIEDACQAIGARIGGQHVGTFGDFGCLSFHPSKLVGSPADGGMMLTNNRALSDRAKALALPDWSIATKTIQPRVPSRLPALAVPFLRERLAALPETIAEQSRSYDMWRDALSNIASLSQLREREGDTLSPRTCIAICDNPEELNRALRYANLIGAPLYGEALSFVQNLPDRAKLPQTERLVARHIRLPTGPEISAEAIEAVGKMLRAPGTRTA